jgi:hypothetical protein
MADPLSVRWSSTKTHIGPILLRVPRLRRSRGTGGLRTGAGHLVLPRLGRSEQKTVQARRWTSSACADDSDDHEAEDQQASQALQRSLARVVEAEASHVESTEYERKAGTVVVRRGEAQLVTLYSQTIPASNALLLSVGRTDLYIVEEGDLIEAKVSAGHRYVRQALGQLLDYAAHCTLPVNRLTALFPEAPEQSDVRLLHIYGIDCLYWTGGNQFSRLRAPAEARKRISASWSRPPAYA